MKSMLMSGRDRVFAVGHSPYSRRCSLFCLTACFIWLLFLLGEQIEKKLLIYQHKLSHPANFEQRKSQEHRPGRRYYYTSSYPDEEAVKFLKENTFFPTARPYNLVQPWKTDFSQYGDNMKVIENLFENRSTPGYFLEIGAWDGEELSNTLYLERSLKWTGLLIEAHREAFKRLKSKNRKATIVNACVANVKGVVRRQFDPEGLTSAWVSESIQNSKSSTMYANCVNIRNILEVAKVKAINYMSLDIEGNEPKFLATFPWDEVPVDVVEIECCYEMEDRVTGGEQFFDTFMDAVGFRFFRKTTGDRIYVRK